MKKIKTIILIILTIFNFSSISLAQINFEENQKIQQEQMYNNNDEQIFNLISWTLSFLALLDTIYIIYNSFGYMNSGEEIYSSGIKKGLIGMFVIFLSYSFTKWLKTLYSLEEEN